MCYQRSNLSPNVSVASSRRSCKNHYQKVSGKAAFVLQKIYENKMDILIFDIGDNLSNYNTCVKFS